MKVFLISIAVLFVCLIILQSYTFMSVERTEQQKYTVIREGNGFEIRYYPSATIATVQSAARSYKELAGPGFRTLAGYIFGGNSSGQKIAMTTPVQMNIRDSASTMSFVMPAAYNQENLPKPNDPQIRISQTDPEYVAAIRFGGFANDKDMKDQAEKLYKLLQEQGIETCGTYRFLGYNPPYQLVGRRNEIIVPVIWK
jgi:hypothetical protein